MAALKRSNRPPYEVMRQTINASDADAARRGDDAGHDSHFETESIAPPRPSGLPTNVTQLFDRIRTPVVMRLPQGYVVLIGIVILALILLAYYVGHSRGMRSVLSSTEAEAGHPYTQEATIPPVRQPAPVNNRTTTGQTVGPTTLNPGTGAAPIVIDAGGRQDPRRTGDNYFVLAHLPEEEAIKLAEFLRTQGVDVSAFRRDNSKLFQVVALEGFSKDALNSSRRNEYEQTLRRAGRAWQAHNRGKGDDLSNLYPARYDGP